jgi:hypothetical protein
MCSLDGRIEKCACVILMGKLLESVQVGSWQDVEMNLEKIGCVNVNRIVVAQYDTDNV